MSFAKEQIVHFLNTHDEDHRQKSRNPVKKTFLTKEEADRLARTTNKIVSHFATVGDIEYCFFSNNHLYGFKDTKNKTLFVPVSSQLPMRVKERPGVEDGWVTNLDKYMAVFMTSKPTDALQTKFIETFDELVDVIQQNDLLTLLRCD